MTLPQRSRRDGRHNETSSTSSRMARVADADLSRSTGSDSDSTEIFASEDKISQRRPSRRDRADLECRRSATYTRRHSSPGPAKEVTTTSQQSPSGVNEAAIRRRRKCQPLHRCASMNDSVSSILKPSKYSPSSSFTSEVGDTTAATIAATAPATKSSRFLRRWSAPSIGSEGLPAASMHSFFLPPSEGKPLNKLQRRPSCDTLDKWVADGVDFCSSVEVHVFRT